MSKSLYSLLNSHGNIDCNEVDTFKGKGISIPRIFGSLASARYSASKYCENIGGNLVYGCCTIVKIKLEVVGKRTKKTEL